MPGFLSHRQPELVEWMDKADCDLDQLHQTYRHFRIVNRFLSGWKRVYKTRIRPKLERDKTNTFLDIGFGGADIPIALEQWSIKDGFKINILAIELDDRALDFAKTLEVTDSITFEKKHTRTLIEEGRTFDFVLSNHVLHHLQDEEVPVLLDEAKQLAQKAVIFNDIERSVLGYGLFASITPLLFRNSFVSKDGLISIKRSFKAEELEQIVPKIWNIDQMPLFRILLTLDKT